MLFDNFARKLRTEAQQWQDEGLIDRDLYEQLAERYQFNNLEALGRDRFVFILIGLGAILLALGVITFVAANWQALSREVRLVLLLSLFLATNIAGFYLWRQPLPSSISARRQQRRKRTFGTGLILLGNLLIGANIGLLAQMFHIGGSAYQLYLAWGLAVVIMACSLHITTLAVLALILLQIGYWTGLSEVYYWEKYQSWGHVIIRHMPLILAVVFVPLAYLCRSQWIFRLSAIAIVTNLQSNLRYIDTLNLNTPFWAGLTVLALPPALLWSYSDSPFSFLNSNLQRFQPIARTLTFVFFGINFYIYSFRWQWESSYQNYTQNISNPIQPWFPVIDVIIFTLIAIWQWCNLLRPRQNTRIEATNIFVGCFIVLSSAVIVLHHFRVIAPAISIFSFNLLLAVLACCLIKEALELGKRGAYWGGIILLTLQIISRMLEYDTQLLFKSFVFILCGVAVIGAGIWFERRTGNTTLRSQNTD
ncbi:hypothetical protein NIES4071_22540 [Calothrix sp. NIES-4071]|nr:hypothetical protein NIES4071_22540 [Calothrix sp. NIES-4071]BAZ56585.1 hypothetical protein NIES4105_22490 [Calothrix sp. NIES-4105]